MSEPTAAPRTTVSARPSGMWHSADLGRTHADPCTMIILGAGGDLSRRKLLPAIYALADAYVMPSRGEGFGFVLLEAMASGVPVIASKADGGREAVRDGALGLLVDPASPAEIRAALVEILDRPPERRIPAGLDYFAYDRFVKRTHAIVDPMLDSRR
jgi:glycosyltransferase involved in cell wall biosynthesis